MTDLNPLVVTAVEAFCDRHQADPGSVEATGLRFFFDDATPAEIEAALDELAVRANGTDPTE